MKLFLTKAALGLTMAATALTVATPADAQRYRHYDRRDNGTGTAIIAGVAGLAIGAAIASNHNDRYDRRYDSRYDHNRRYSYNRGYYPSNSYYSRSNRYRGCDVRRVYDRRLHRTVLVRYCR